MMFRVSLLLLLVFCVATGSLARHHHRHHHPGHKNSTAVDVADVDQADEDVRSDEQANPHARNIRRAAAEKDHEQLNNPVQGTYLSMKLHKDKKMLPRIAKRAAKRDGARMVGSLYDTYLATVTIQGDHFTCIMDTGSSDFAVAASEQCGCATYYKGECNGPYLNIAYGDGNWTGNGCKDEVIIDGFELGNVVFAGMKTQYDMLECASGNEQNGIIGLAFPPLLGPPVDYTKPFFDLLVDHNKGMKNVFGMQCCMWVDQSTDGLEHAEGRLDLGFLDPTHYAGPIVYTPITEKVFYTVDMIDVKVGNQSVWPRYRPGRDPKRSTPSVHQKHHHYHHHSSHPHERPHPHHKDITDDELSKLPYAPDTIVDSGTSNLIFTQDTFDLIMAALKKHQPNQPDKVWKGEDCIAHGTGIEQTWPEISLTFAGEPGEPDFDLIIPPCRYLMRAPADQCDNKQPGHAFSIDAGELSEGNILGQVLFESYYVVHDLRGKGRVGFAQLAGCKDSLHCPNRDVKILEHATRDAPAQLITPMAVDTLNFHVPIEQSSSFGTLVMLSMMIIIGGIAIHMMIKYKQQQEYIPL